MLRRDVYRARGRGDHRYDDAFKAEAVSLVIDKKLTFRKAATEVGVSYETLRTWVDASGRRAAVQETKSDQQRIKELERENRCLRMERDILSACDAEAVLPADNGFVEHAGTGTESSASVF